MKNFNRCFSHGHHGWKRRELAQHALAHGSHAFTHTLTSTQLDQPSFPSSSWRSGEGCSRRTTSLSYHHIRSYQIRAEQSRAVQSRAEQIVSCRVNIIYHIGLRLVGCVAFCLLFLRWVYFDMLLKHIMSEPAVTVQFWNWYGIIKCIDSNVYHSSNFKCI